MPVLKRPAGVTVIACLYIVMGAVGFAYHFRDLRDQPFRFDGIGVEALRLLAIVCGVFLLRRQNWARWVAFAWIAFHVLVSALHNLGEMAMHAIFCALIVWALFREDAEQYFVPDDLRAV